MKAPVQIVTDGIAAAACAALMSRLGCQAQPISLAEPAMPFLTLDSSVVRLLTDIFGTQVQMLPLFGTTARLVVHHRNQSISRVNQPLFVTRASQLLECIKRSLAMIGPCEGGLQVVIRAGNRIQGAISSGRRTAYVFAGVVSGPPAGEAAIFEFTPDGWIFWAPLSVESGFCQFVVPRPSPDDAALCAHMFQTSLVLRHCVALEAMTGGPWDCAAVLNENLIGENWIACGGSALRYDPISGSGTGTSLRSAILACATLRGMSEAPNPQPYREYYRSRLSAAFREHVAVCRRLYTKAQSSNWDDECTAMDEAMQRTVFQFPGKDALRFRLDGYLLKARS